MSGYAPANDTEQFRTAVCKAGGSFERTNGGGIKIDLDGRVFEIIERGGGQLVQVVGDPPQKITVVEEYFIIEGQAFWLRYDAHVFARVIAVNVGLDFVRSKFPDKFPE